MFPVQSRQVGTALCCAWCHPSWLYSPCEPMLYRLYTWYGTAAAKKSVRWWQNQQFFKFYAATVFGRTLLATNFDVAQYDRYCTSSHQYHLNTQCPLSLCPCACECRAVGVLVADHCNVKPNIWIILLTNIHTMCRRDHPFTANQCTATKCAVIAQADLPRPLTWLRFGDSVRLPSYTTHWTLIYLLCWTEMWLMVILRGVSPSPSRARLLSCGQRQKRHCCRTNMNSLKAWHSRISPTKITSKLCKNTCCI
jgi:hypothetical protein